jgi:hypothetical protein
MELPAPLVPVPPPPWGRVAVRAATLQPRRAAEVPGAERPVRPAVPVPVREVRVREVRLGVLRRQVSAPGAVRRVPGVVAEAAAGWHWKPPCLAAVPASFAAVVPSGAEDLGLKLAVAPEPPLGSTAAEETA